MAVTAIQSNMPPGGTVATQPVTPAGQMTPADIQAVVEALTPIQARFRQQSTFLKTDLQQASFSLTAPSTTVAGSSVGLAVRLISVWNVTITVANGATSAQTYSLSPLFPYNLVQNTQVQINGGAATFSASGVATLITMLRQRRGTRRLDSSGGFGPALSPALSSITLGSNLTATNTVATAQSLSGIASISVAASASANNTMTLKFVTIERLVLDKDSLLGALPLQNQSTNVQIQRRIVSALSGTRNDATVPFYSAGANLTFTLTACTCDTTYEFASVPPDPGLYAAMVSNAFEIVEQTSQTVSATGAKALAYNIPQNKYLVAAHILGVDGNGAALKAFDATNGLGNLYLTYNANTITPILLHADRQRADSFLSYGDDLESIPGWRMFDGEDTSDSITETDNMGWLDTYAAANPQLQADVGTSATTNLTYSLTREAIVAGAVQTIGG